MTADMTRLPFTHGQFDVVVCADNAIAHLLTEERLASALAEMYACCGRAGCSCSPRAARLSATHIRDGRRRSFARARPGG